MPNTHRSAHRLLVSTLTALMAFVSGRSLAGDPDAETVERDWDLRETLIAIDDWESILVRWEAGAPKADQTPTLPVPTDGSAVTWPNPIPRRLLPRGDEDERVRVQLADQRVKVGRFQAGAAAQSSENEALDYKPGLTVLGYHHPGGGGKNHWYHRYERRFDRLTTFQPKPAPFVLDFPEPWDPQPGTDAVSLTLKNITDRPLTVVFQSRFFWRRPVGQAAAGNAEDQDAVAQETAEPVSLTLAAGSNQAVRLPTKLAAPGGGLIVLAITANEQSYWLPLLTHVEDVPAVLRSIDQILTDTPHDATTARLRQLQTRVGDRLRTGQQSSGDEWRTLFLEASALRDELLLKRISFDRILFVKRKPFYSEQPFMDAHHTYNRPGGGIYCLAPVRPDGKVTAVVDSLGNGIYRDLCLRWDADRILFSFGNGSDRVPAFVLNSPDKPPAGQDYDLYEVDVDGQNLRQVTSDPDNDCEPFYLPNGQIGFTSDRTEQIVMCGSNIHVASLFTMNADGSNARQLGFNVFNEFNPSILPDGRIIYDRWEYNERSVTSLHDLFTIHPDGTQVAPYYGNATIRPNVIMFPRSVPGSRKVMALFTGHHGQTHGPIGLIDVHRGRDGDAPVTVLTPRVPTIGEKIEDSRAGWYSDPVPLSETTYLCSFTPTVLPWLERSWALYIGDRHGNLALVYRDRQISCAEPVPMIASKRPAVLPPVTPDADTDDAQAALLLLDVYGGQSELPRRTAKFLRILEDVPRKGVPTGGVICTAGTSIYTIKRIHGTVPIEPDGSAHFTVPANRNVYFEVLDENQREIQRMRSTVCLKPNEQRTCVGCHEPRAQAPPNAFATASQRAPSQPAPPPWGTRTVSFLRDVQPLISAKCAQCHTYDRLTCGAILTDDLTDQFTVAYEELLPYLSVANAMRWDLPDDVYPRPPYTYGSAVSALTKLLVSGHHDVSLTDEEWGRLSAWIDTNGVYYDCYETYYPNRHIFTGPVDDEIRAVYARRCAKCHGTKDDGSHDSWWRSLNRYDVRKSRALQAPLARSAGGWQQCDRIVFADTADADYQRLLAALTRLSDTLSERPRADLLSVRGTPAEHQIVELPPPPPPRLDAMNPAEFDADWVPLSNLEWESASAGWSRNKDGLPRRDHDAGDQRLRLGKRRFRKGIGTHAPSTIVYRLDAKYSRFVALIGGAETNGTVVFRVLGDDKQLYESGVLHGLREVEQIDVPVSGVRTLRLEVTDAGDNYFCDMANWADARLRREGGEGGEGRAER